MDALQFQSRAMQRLGEFPSDRQLQHAFATLIGDASALRTLVSLDGSSWIDDDDACAHIGALCVALAEAACALGVDLGEAMRRGADAADQKVLQRAALLADRRAARTGSA